MKTKFASLICSAIAVVAALYGLKTGAQAQQPPITIEESPIFVNYMKAPDTLAGLAAEADAVVVGTISRHRVRKQMDVPGAVGEAVYTDYILQTEDIIKNHQQLPQVGSEITVVRSGGEVSGNGRLMRSIEVGFPRFEKNGRYLLFLRLNPKTYQFEVLHGPTGVYRVKGDILESIGGQSVAKKQHGKATNAVVADLKARQP